MFNFFCQNVPWQKQKMTETRTKTILATVIVKRANKNGQQKRLVILIEKLELLFYWFLCGFS
jgi:hypothetical protein